MCVNEKREIQNAGPPKSQERLELNCADSSGNGNGGALFKSVYPSAHRDGKTQFSVCKEPRGNQKEAELPAMPEPVSISPEKQNKNYFKKYFSVKNM